jgi:hypothetical protein
MEKADSDDCKATMMDKDVEFTGHLGIGECVLFESYNINSTVVESRRTNSTFVEFGRENSTYVEFGRKDSTYVEFVRPLRNGCTPAELTSFESCNPIF